MPAYERARRVRVHLGRTSAIGTKLVTLDGLRRCRHGGAPGGEVGVRWVGLAPATVGRAAGGRAAAAVTYRPAPRGSQLGRGAAAGLAAVLIAPGSSFDVDAARSQRSHPFSPGSTPRSFRSWRSGRTLERTVWRVVRRNYGNLSAIPMEVQRGSAGLWREIDALVISGSRSGSHDRRRQFGVEDSMSRLAPNGAQQAGDGGRPGMGVLSLTTWRPGWTLGPRPSPPRSRVVIGRSSGPATASAELVADTQAFVRAVAESLRSGRRRCDPALLERWRAFGRRQAAADMALSRLIETLDLQARDGHRVARRRMVDALPGRAHHRGIPDVHHLGAGGGAAGGGDRGLSRHLPAASVRTAFGD